MCATADKLTSYLRQKATSRFSWGELDCAIFVADWVELLSGSDPMPDYRGKYYNVEEAHELLSGGDGLVGVVNCCAERAGMLRVSDDSYRVGDIAVIRLLIGDFCAIRSLRGWMLFGTHRVSRIVDAEVLTAWRVKCDG